MSKKKILIQLDSDQHASSFDRVVAVDSGVDQLFAYSHVGVDDVCGLVHGAIFTRGPKDLSQTAIFVGGSDVSVGEELLASVRRTFFGPFRVSVMLDANGANTTAAAAIVAAGRHVPLSESVVTVLAATGPVGQRAVRMLTAAGATVRVCSRRLLRAEEVCRRLREAKPTAQLEPFEVNTRSAVEQALRGAQAVIAAGAHGVQLVDRKSWSAAHGLSVAIDLNAVPPAGVEGIELNDGPEQRDSTWCYGAIGIGGMKMALHKAAIRRLFTSNDLVLDADEIFDLGLDLDRTSSS